MGRSFGFPKLEFHRPGPSNEPSEHQPRHPKLRPGDGFVSASNQLIFLGGGMFFSWGVVAATWLFPHF